MTYLLCSDTTTDIIIDISVTYSLIYCRYFLVFKIRRIFCYRPSPDGEKKWFNLESVLQQQNTAESSGGRSVEDPRDSINFERAVSMTPFASKCTSHKQPAMRQFKLLYKCTYLWICSKYCTIYSNNIFIGTSSYRISLARCCGGYLLSLSAMLWTAISSAVAAAAAAVLEMLSLAMFPIATLGIFEFPPKKVLDQNISNPFEFKQILWISMDVVSWHVAKPDHFFFDTKKQRKKHSAGPPVHLNHPKCSGWNGWMPHVDGHLAPGLQSAGATFGSAPGHWTSPLPNQVAHGFPTISTVFNQMITI